MDKKNLNILTNIIGGVETGGQTYGKRNYASYVAPGKNTANEKTCTLGWAGSYGERAKRLCKMILEQNPAAFRKVDTAGIEKKLSANWETSKWHPTAKEKAALIAIITTPTGKECQDALFQELMQTYLKDAEAYGVTDIQSQMMWCEIQHLGGIKPVQRIFKRAEKPYTPDTIYSSLLLDQKDTSNNNQVGDKIFQSRARVLREVDQAVCNRYKGGEKSDKRCISRSWIRNPINKRYERLLYYQTGKRERTGRSPQRKSHRKAETADA